MRRCPYCGSTRLVWDEERGYLVCADCGAVIEQLFYEGPTRSEARWDFQSTRAVLRLRASPQPSPASRPARQRERAIQPAHDTQGDPLLRESLREVSSRGYTGRIAVALAHYISSKLLGMSNEAALRVASNASGLTQRYLSKKLRYLSVEIRSAMENVGELFASRENRVRDVGSLEDSKEATRADVR
ncbi:MAG: TFIIB-type zinc ribbon-containing protein [Desulfurococcales archaeon]|nr:TFIIB-type zinc ribbon-containing protein [Desulfurococcales archaeon]